MRGCGWSSSRRVIVCLTSFVVSVKYAVHSNNSLRKNIGYLRERDIRRDFGR